MALPDTDAMVVADALGMGYTDADSCVHPVIHEVSFSISPGEAIGFVGESGSGKSTLARALLGYRRLGGVFTGGSLRYRGQELTTAKPEILRAMRGLSVAMVAQNPLASLTFHQRVGDQILEVLRCRTRLNAEAARLRMLELLERTGIQDPGRVALRYPHQLSGGQRQRVVIASALACNPSLLVLDEPTTALDKSTESQVLDLVREMRQQSGAALVLVTHDLNVVARVCDRVLVMKNGRIVEQGPVRQVFSRPDAAYTRMLVAASLQIDPSCEPPAASPGAELLRVQDLHFSYPRGSWLFKAPAHAPALKNISLSVGKGEVLGVIGESGSGKSTLGLILAGILSSPGCQLQWEGRALGTSLRQRTADQLRRIQMVFQDPLSSFNPRQTVGAALERALRRHLGLAAGPARARAQALFAELGLDASHLERYPRKLSGGQQQRAAIARAFAAEPDLLICDEITSALDASIQSQLLDQLQQMQSKRSTAMLIITHDLSVIWKMAPRVVVLKDGEIIEQGDTAQVFMRPQAAYTAALIRAATSAHDIRASCPTNTAFKASD